MPLKKGDKILAMLAAANYDPSANEHPEELKLQRRPNRHIAFGTGIHFCLGHQLARIEGRCALKALFTRWPKLELAVDPSQVRWRPRSAGVPGPLAEAARTKGYRKVAGRELNFGQKAAGSTSPGNKSAHEEDA